MVTSLEDREAGIKLPQIVFECRADDLIDIASFARLDEKTMWQALVNAGIKFEDWSARKEYEDEKPIVRIYMELKQKLEVDDLENRIHKELTAINKDYNDLEKMLNLKPLRITVIPSGGFQHYYEERKKKGAELAHLKPPHMNASDSVIKNLLKIAEGDI